MSIAFTVHPDLNLAYFRLRGRTDVAECARAYTDYLKHSDFQPNHIMLTSTVDLENIDASFTRILVAVERVAPTFRLFRTETTSVIHARDDVVFGLARMLQQIVEPLSKFRFDVHRTEEMALKAAGLAYLNFAELDAHLGLMDNCA